MDEHIPSLDQIDRKYVLRKGRDPNRENKTIRYVRTASPEQESRLPGCGALAATGREDQQQAADYRDGAQRQQ